MYILAALGLHYFGYVINALVAIYVIMCNARTFPLANYEYIYSNFGKL